MQAPPSKPLEGIVVAQFADEPSVVLFVPCSGEVFLCAADDWEQFEANPTDKPSVLKDVLLRSCVPGL